MTVALRSSLRKLWVFGGLAFTVWIIWGYQASGVPDTALQTTSAVRVVEDNRAIHFIPRATRRGNGVIFLPGGMVSPAAYAPLMKSIAAAGHPAHLVPLPYRTAYTESQVNDLFSDITSVINANRETRWWIAGHSRGAMLAARYARESQTHIGGLILIGTTHPRDFDLSASPLPVTKILGSNDGVATPADARVNAKFLPPSTVWVEIPGANHVQFGYYGHQLMDHAATISRDEQQTALLKAIRRALGS